ncbi:hypothetical protein OPU71_16750 [Niveibacterium sp. 24ML]|uniref:hypothetical protein n=1 Tax=Niveibacterium sp. 24ML TaxID=2985512 RepID=UPI00226F6F54|nr:hypothetical protein [Niveibacterium sp. 24ML]MCX9157775.1 hypothetical protein [Niveibacterium sp. 24ML]
MTQRGWYIKHMMSCASDLEVSVGIDFPGKCVTLTMAHFDSALVERLVTVLLPRDGIEVWRDDNSGWHPLPATWDVVCELAGVRYRLDVVKLFQISPTAPPSYTLVLRPPRRPA